MFFFFLSLLQPVQIESESLWSLFFGWDDYSFFLGKVAAEVLACREIEGVNGEQRPAPTPRGGG